MKKLAINCKARDHEIGHTESKQNAMKYKHREGEQLPNLYKFFSSNLGLESIFANTRGETRV